MSGLRVIGGKARGRKLRPVPGSSTRPITDRTKESLFNIIGADISEAKLLDLFAGTGSVGIEALSRGAGFVRFLDIQRQAVATIQDNLESTGIAKSKQSSIAEVIRLDAFEFLKRPADIAFDYIYVAPPQYHQMWKQVLFDLDKNLAWLSGDAWVIVQIHPIEYEVVDMLNLTEFDQRRYGSTLLVFYHVKEN